MNSILKGRAIVTRPIHSFRVMCNRLMSPVKGCPWFPTLERRMICSDPFAGEARGVRDPWPLRRSGPGKLRSWRIFISVVSVSEPRHPRPGVTSRGTPGRAPWPHPAAECHASVRGQRQSVVDGRGEGVRDAVRPGHQLARPALSREYLHQRLATALPPPMHP